MQANMPWEADDHGTELVAGLRRDVCLAYVPDVAVGAYVIVHVGFAIAAVDQAEAERTLGCVEMPLPHSAA